MSKKYLIIFGIRSFGEFEFKDAYLETLHAYYANNLKISNNLQKSQTIHSIKRSNINFISNTLVYIPIMHVIKQTRPGNHLKPLEFKPYKDKKLCVISHLTEYLERTKLLVPNEEKLVVSFIKPHKAVPKDTISKWCKSVLKMSNIDTSKYSTHSSRSAATSKALTKGIPMKTIIDSAGWKNERIFATMYNREIENDFDIVD